MSTATTMNDSASTRAPRLNRRSLVSSQSHKFEAWVVRNSDWVAIGIILLAFVLRIAWARACYLNPDEAQHFDSARINSWAEAYKASRWHNHPPLFILLLHGILVFGRSEIILRVPSLLGGTAALWLTFAWIRRSLGSLAAIAGLLFMAISSAAISASTEVRQYGLLLCFVCGALYATERALSERAAGWATIQGGFLLGALLTHYIAPVVFLPLDLYVLYRCASENISKRLLLVFVAGQFLLAAVLAYLYFTHIRQSMSFSASALDYLQDFYYVKSKETLFEYGRRAFLSTFGYMVSPKQAIYAVIVFLAGLAALVGRIKGGRPLALLVVSVFAIGFGMSVAHVFPFIGTRHEAYLLPFAAIAFSAALSWIPRPVCAPLLLLVIVAAPFWIKRHPPDNNPQYLALGYMKAAIEYIHQTIPPGAPIFLDDESRYELEYYLERDNPRVDVPNHHQSSNEMLGGHLILNPAQYTWSFGAENVFTLANLSASKYGMHAGDPLWIVSVPWMQSSLVSQVPPGKLLAAKEFGHISVFQIVRQ